VQEALVNQVNDLFKLLPGYKWIGVGRDDGAAEGEFMAIFYLEDRFQVLEDSTFWLSENPSVPGNGWDAACNRVVTFGKFFDIPNNKEFYLFNTHFDHLGEKARLESAKLLTKSIYEIAENDNIIVTGDFNSLPSSEVYNILTGVEENNGNTIGLKDAKMVSNLRHHGPDFTYTGFQLSKLSENNKIIDYIFVGNSITVLKHGILSDTFNGRFPSDHFPVFAVMVIK
jgi:endonuclease/exonuclease/phosphatase family metal-dependent hydrolase